MQRFLLLFGGATPKHLASSLLRNQSLKAVIILLCVTVYPMFHLIYCTGYKVYMELLFQSDYCVVFYKLLEDEDYSPPCCMIICSRKANLASVIFSPLLV